VAAAGGTARLDDIGPAALERGSNKEFSMEQLDGGVFFDAKQVEADEYLPNKGVWLARMLGKHRGDAFGFYFGRIEPGCEIAREHHEQTTETVYVLKGKAVCLVGDREVPLEPGQVMHIDKNVPHGVRNVGSDTLEMLVIGQPDF
jgi:mannose-6-phosphate isomerase-like protein (cupin superfamily)